MQTNINIFLQAICTFFSEQFGDLVFYSFERELERLESALVADRRNLLAYSLTADAELVGYRSGLKTCPMAKPRDHLSRVDHIRQA